MGRLWGVPIMASDAVSSVAYAIEEILIALTPALGLLAARYLAPIALPIILLLVVLVLSYAQTIDCYPSGGGAYVVSAENLGRGAALTAAAALIVDYIMTVAVSISAATAAFLAAFPEFIGWRVPIALLFLCVITILNLRGVRESSKIFGVPTYGFILLMGLLIVVGLTRLALGQLSPIQYDAAVLPAADAAGSLTLFLALKAFSSGCSALTGVEAVSNAVPSFREPSQRNAKQVLYIMGSIIIFIFGGTALLATSLGVMPVANDTVVSQLGRAVFGVGPLFYALQFATSLILLLAANTTYNGLPTLLAILGGDGFLPRQFMQRGTRLSFSNGILFIFFVSGLLLIAFRADTHHLIPMYAVGVFLSFTLSQTGMVIRWIKHRGKGWRHRLLINAVGAMMTVTGTVIVFATKFIQGAWMLAVVIPLICALMHYIHRHYEFIKGQLRVDDFMAHYHKSVSLDENLCIVLASSLSRSVLKSLNYANLLTSNVVALHIATDEKKSEKFKAKWEALGIDVPLEVIQTAYRDVVEPLEEYIAGREKDLPPGDTISVVMVRFVEEHWYDNILHNQTTYFIERRMRTHKNVATIIVPYIYSAKYGMPPGEVQEEKEPTQ